MKIELEINDKNGCRECPYSYYLDRYDNWRLEDNSEKTLKDGFYCKRMGDKYITEFFNNESRNGIIIPEWCPFKCKEEKQTKKWEMVDDDVCLDSFDIYDD